MILYWGQKMTVNCKLQGFCLLLLLGFLYPLNSVNAQSSETQLGSTLSAQKQELKGYATTSDTMPFYMSQNGPHLFRINSGSRFVAICETGLASNTANIGDVIEAKLAKDVSYAGQIVIPKSSILKGHVSLVDRARHSLRAELPGKHWLNAQGAIGLQFTEIIVNGKSFPINATPAPRTLVNSVAAVRFPVVIDKQGDIAVSYSGGKYSCLALAIEGGSLAAGPIGLVVGSAVSGLAGAASPSYALGHPDEQKGFKERSKGFLLGVAKGLPGVGLVTDAVEHGSELSIASGDSFVVELKEDLEIDFEHRK